MLYPICPTCGVLLAAIEIPFLQKKKIIVNDASLSDEEKEKRISKLVCKYVDKYCCRVRLLTFVDLIEIIK